jgi:hypothetical protein
MTGFGLGRRRAVRGIGTLVVATCCAGGVAAGASAATLQLKLRTDDGHGNPTNHSGPIRFHKSFHLLVTGSYSRSELSGRAFLIGFLQQGDTSPCRRNPSKEKAKAASQFSTLAGRSPFGWDFSFRAGSAGSRRVCVYLQPERSSTATPLKRATLTFTVKR